MAIRTYHRASAIGVACVAQGVRRTFLAQSPLFSVAAKAGLLLGRLGQHSTIVVVGVVAGDA